MQLLSHGAQTWNSKRLIGGAALILTISLFVTFVWAGNVLKVSSLGSLIANPESYRLKVVRITAVVGSHQLKHIKELMNNDLERNMSAADKCIQTFTLTDETGTIQAIYGAICSGSMDLLRNRDLVTIQGRFEWVPGKAGIFKVDSVLTKQTPYP